MDAIKPFSASTVSFKDVAGTAKENMAAIDRELEELSKRREELAREIATYGDQRKSLQISLDRLNQEVAKETVREKMLTDGTVGLSGRLGRRDQAGGASKRTGTLHLRL